MDSTFRGGEEEIRTLGGFLVHTAFRERHLQPLGHLSITYVILAQDQGVRFSRAAPIASLYFAPPASHQLTRKLAVNFVRLHQPLGHLSTDFSHFTTAASQQSGIRRILAI